MSESNQPENNDEAIEPVTLTIMFAEPPQKGTEIHRFAKVTETLRGWEHNGDCPEDVRELCAFLLGCLSVEGIEGGFTVKMSPHWIDEAQKFIEECLEFIHKTVASKLVDAVIDVAHDLVCGCGHDHPMPENKKDWN